MTAIFVFAALIIANVAYCVFDGRRAEAARQIDDFYRVEFKKNYGVKDEIAAQNWYWSFRLNMKSGWLRLSAFFLSFQIFVIMPLQESWQKDNKIKRRFVNFKNAMQAEKSKKNRKINEKFQKLLDKALQTAI